MPSFSINGQLWVFGPILSKKRFKHKTMIWSTFMGKGYFQFKTENMNTTIEVSIFELVVVTNFTLK